MSAQTFAQRPRQSTNAMREAFYRTQDEQYDRMAHKARRAVKRARALRQEAETFLASLDV